MSTEQWWAPYSRFQWEELLIPIRYKILQDTHESEQNKAHEMSDALRNSVRILKGYIDRSDSTSFPCHSLVPCSTQLSNLLLKYTPYQTFFCLIFSNKRNFSQEWGCERRENERVARSIRDTKVNFSSSLKFYWFGLYFTRPLVTLINDLNLFH